LLLLLLQHQDRALPRALACGCHHLLQLLLLPVLAYQHLGLLQRQKLVLQQQPWQQQQLARRPSTRVATHHTTACGKLQLLKPVELPWTPLLQQQ
jgi:hypothetical protein